MWQSKDEQEEATTLQNHFTAYLIKAIQRQKKDYMNKKNRLLDHEVSDDFLEKVVADQNPIELLEQSLVPICLENMQLSWDAEDVHYQAQSIVQPCLFS